MSLAAAVFALLLPQGLMLAPPPSGDQAIEELERWRRDRFKTIAPSVVFITHDDHLGSGFFVDGKGLILTNAHVVGTAKRVKVVLNDGRRFTGKVVRRAKKGVDLALVQIDMKQSPSAELGSTKDLRIGDWVATVGHGTGGIWTFNTGMVSNIYPSGATRPVFQTQIPLNPGASGGPIIDRRGRVVGIVTAGIVEANAVNYGIKIDVAMSEFSELAGSCACITVRAPKGVAVFVDGKMVGKGPDVRVPVGKGAHEVMAVVGGTMKKKVIVYPKVKTVDLR